VRYRLAGLREIFGTALDDPAARLELAVALRAGGRLDPGHNGGEPGI
jgi:DNA-binding PucR family transcriptional regulator